MEYLALYSSDCKKCGHLDPDESFKYDKCHYSRGNPECPAKEIQFAIVGEAKRFAHATKRARDAGDFAREVKILKAVAGRSEAFQHKYREWSK